LLRHQRWNVRTANRRHQGTGLLKDNVAKDKARKGHAAKVEGPGGAIAGARTVGVKAAGTEAAIEVTTAAAIARASKGRLKSTSRN
jgi:hypothetical protein